jgi:hypothetical protein
MNSKKPAPRAPRPDARGKRRGPPARPRKRPAKRDTSEDERAASEVLRLFSAPVVDPDAAARWAVPDHTLDEWEAAAWGRPEAFEAYVAHEAACGRRVYAPHPRVLAAIRWAQIGAEVAYRQLLGIPQPWEGGPRVAACPGLYQTPSGRVAVIGARVTFEAASRAIHAVVALIDAVAAIPGADPAPRHELARDLDAITARVRSLFPKDETPASHAADFACAVDVSNDGAGGRTTRILFPRWADVEAGLLLMFAPFASYTVFAAVDGARGPDAFKKQRQRLRLRAAPRPVTGG